MCYIVNKDTPQTRGKVYHQRFIFAVQDMAGTAGDKAQEAAGSAKKTAQDTANSAGDAAQSAADSATKGAEGAADATGSAGEQAGEAARGFVAGESGRARRFRQGFWY